MLRKLLPLLLLSLPLYGQTPITPEIIPAGAVTPIYRATVQGQPAEPYCPRQEYAMKWFVVTTWVSDSERNQWIVNEGGFIRVFTGPHDGLRFEPMCVPQSIGEPIDDPLNGTYTVGSAYVSNGDTLKVKPHPAPKRADKQPSPQATVTPTLHTCHNNLLWCDQNGVVVEGFDPHKLQPFEQVGDGGTNEHTVSGWLSNWIDTTVRRYNK